MSEGHSALVEIVWGDSNHYNTCLTRISLSLNAVIRPWNGCSTQDYIVKTITFKEQLYIVLFLLSVNLLGYLEMYILLVLLTWMVVTYQSLIKRW